MCVSLKKKTQNCMWHYRSVHGPGISGVPRRSGSWRTASGKSRMKIFHFPEFFSKYFSGFSWIFSGFWQLLFWAARTWTNKKFATNFFQSKNHKKQYYYYAITYLPIANCSKNLDEERKKKLFWFFRDAESNILICNIHLVWLHSAS